MITEVKDILGATLVKAGITRSKIARNAREEKSLISNTSLPIASLVSEPGRFESPEHKEVRLRIGGRTLYRQLRTKRVMPVAVKLMASDESGAEELINKFLANLPFIWEYQGIQGQMEPTRAEYSDCESGVNTRYEALVVVECAVDVGPEGTSAQRIEGINEQEGAYEEVNR